MTRGKGLFSTVALAVTGALVGLLVVGCGIQPTGVIYGQGAPQGAVSSMMVYLLDHNTLRAVARPLPPTPTASPNSGKIIPYIPPDVQALNTLLRGPTATEASAGLTSDIPPDAAGDVKPGTGGVIVVFIKTGEEVSLTQHAVDQIACTVITAQLIDSATDNLKAFRVTVFDSGNRSRTPQGCPSATP